MPARLVTRRLQIRVACRTIRRYILRRNHIYVPCVGKLSDDRLRWWSTFGHTPERNLTHAPNVPRGSQHQTALPNTWGHTQGRNLTHVEHVVKCSLRLEVWLGTWCITMGRKVGYNASRLNQGRGTPSIVKCRHNRKSCNAKLCLVSTNPGWPNMWNL